MVQQAQPLDNQGFGTAAPNGNFALDYLGGMRQPGQDSLLGNNFLQSILSGQGNLMQLIQQYIMQSHQQNPAVSNADEANRQASPANQMSQQLQAPQQAAESGGQGPAFASLQTGGGSPLRDLLQQYFQRRGVTAPDQQMQDKGPQQTLDANRNF